MPRKRKKIEGFFPVPADNPFGDHTGMTIEKRLLSDLAELGYSEAGLDFSEADYAAGHTSAPFPSWNTETADETAVNHAAPVSHESADRKQDEDKVYEYDVAEHLATNYSTATYQGIPYIKIDGVDTPLTSNLVGSLIEKSMPKYKKRKISSRNFQYIQEWLKAILDQKEHAMTRDPHLILFENGLFDFRTGKTIPPFRAKNKFLPVRINASYYPDNPPETPVWDQFIEDCSGGDPEIIQLIHEFVGYMLAPCDPDQIILMAPQAGSGKSVLCTVVRQILSYDRTSAIALANFSKAFEVAQIYGKVANFCPDISSAVLSDTTTASLKRLSGSDAETINAKNQQPFQYTNYAKLVFACNEGGIRLRHPDSGFARRLIVIPFLYSTPRHKMDKNLKDKLWAERDGIVWKAIEALKAMYIRYGSCSSFCYCREGEKLKRQYMGVAEPSVQDFIEEYCMLSPEEREWTSTMYQKYLSYCRECDLQPVGRKRFAQMIYSVPGVRQHKYQKNKTQLQGADGICLK